MWIRIIGNKCSGQNVIVLKLINLYIFVRKLSNFTD